MRHCVIVTVLLASPAVYADAPKPRVPTTMRPSA